MSVGIETLPPCEQKAPREHSQKKMLWQTLEQINGTPLVEDVMVYIGFSSEHFSCPPFF